MSKLYYSHTAYDSTRMETLPEVDIKDVGRKRHGYSLPRFSAAQCKEFLAVDSISSIERLNADDEESQKFIASPGHEQRVSPSAINPKAYAEAISILAFFFSVPAWAYFILMALIILFMNFKLLFDPQFLYFLLPAAILTIIHNTCDYMIAIGIIPDKNNIILNRRKGTVLLPTMKNPTQEILFKEFNAYRSSGLNADDSISYHLTFCHRYSKAWFQISGPFKEEWEAYQEWEYWKQFMDVSKPLPDTPKLEPFRYRDPVTAKFDKEHNRPTDYWKNMDLDKAKKMRAAAIEAVSKYPWRKTREDAIAGGWKPSGFGEGGWQRNKRLEIQENRADAN